MSKIKSNSRSIYLGAMLILLGIGVRLMAATRGYNFDVKSFMIVADIVEHGGNVYNNTARYNYGPIWFYVLHGIDLIASQNQVVFRYLLTFFLSLVDVGIFVILWWKINRLTATLFLFNPISIIITGYHSQFDNLAILLGMLSAICMGDDFDKGLSIRKLLGLFILGLSLMTKQIFFIFPLWLSVKQRGFPQKIAVFSLPIIVFLAGFLPYWRDGKQGIIQNVFLYDSLNNGYFYKLFVPMFVQVIFTSRMVWILLLIVFAVILRQRTVFESLLLYTCVLVGTSPAIANQYLAIVIPFIAMVTPSPFVLSYTIIGTWYLMGHRNGLHIYLLQRFVNGRQEAYYAILVSMLCLELVWFIWHQNLISLLRKAISEIRIQLSLKES